MIIHVGSTNQTKIQAVKDAVLLYPTLFPSPEVTGVEVDIQEFGHPKNLEQTIEGAIKRARESFEDAKFSFGLEGGLMEVPYTKTGYMEVGVCAVFDGTKISLGLSPAFEWPEKVTEMIVRNKADASQAFNKLGLTSHEKLGALPGGILGVLTGGKITREKQTLQSIIMALIELDKPEFFI